MTIRSTNLTLHMLGVVPESQCVVKREQKKLRDKDKKDYPSQGSPVAEEKAVPTSPVSSDVSMMCTFYSWGIISCIRHSLYLSGHGLSLINVMFLEI